MDKPKWSAEALERENQDHPFMTAEALRIDFDQLIAVFDRRLASHSGADGEVRSHILEAKAAAERGRKLSQDLIELLRSDDLQLRNFAK